MPSHFPPTGWLAYPGQPGLFYRADEVLTEADLRSRFGTSEPTTPKPTPRVTVVHAEPEELPEDDEPEESILDASSALGDCLKLIERIRKDAKRHGLTGQERARLADAEGKQLGLRARLEKEANKLEVTIIRTHPEWARVKSSILNALKPYPKAAAAVVEALAETGA